MKFTSEDLMKAMGLQVGDKIKVDTFDNSDFEVREAYDMGHKEIVLVDDNEEMFSLTLAFGYEYEILPRPKRVGELKCEYYVNCDDGCPLCWLCTHYDRNMLSKEIREDFNLYDILNAHNFDFADEIHDLLKARLDKEVVEDDENI